MGRQKIVIKKQELRAQRRISFNKRSFSVKKKAMELSVLSDAKMMLLLQSPDGEYDLFMGENSTFDDIVQQFLSEGQEKRNKSWESSMEVLEKAFREDVQSAEVLMDHRMSHTEKKASQERELASIKEDISKLESQLGPLRNIDEIDKIDSVNELTEAKILILELLVKNEREKEIFIKQRRSGFHNFTIPNTRDLKCFTSTEIPAPTDNHVPALTDPNVPVRTDPYVPAPTDPYLPAPTNPYLPAPIDTYIPVPTGPYVPAPTNPYLPAPTGPYLPASTNPYIPASTGPYVPVPTGPYLPAPTGPYVPAPTDPYLPALTNPYLPAPTNPYIPAPTYPHLPAPTDGIWMSNSTALYQGGEATCSTSNAGSWSSSLHQRVDQEEVLMPNMYESSEREYQEQISEIERSIEADPASFFG